MVQGWSCDLRQCSQREFQGFFWECWVEPLCIHPGCERGSRLILGLDDGPPGTMEGNHSQYEADTAEERFRRQKENRSLVTLLRTSSACDWPYLGVVLLHKPINFLYCLSWVDLGFCFLQPRAGLGLEALGLWQYLCLWLMWIKTETQTNMNW